MPSEHWHHDGEAGRWSFWRRQPSAPLAGYVAELQAYWESGGQPLIRRELPSGNYPLIIVLDHGFALADSREAGGWRPLRSSFAAGLSSGPSTVASAGAATCMQVDFTPLGAYRFFRCDLDSLTGRVITFDRLAPGFASALDERVADCPTWEARLDLLEVLVARRILEVPAGDRRVTAAYHALTASKGALSITTLANRLDLSRKHLNTLFKREIGLSPKRYARNLRFDLAIQCLSSAQDGISLAQLAADCGYADQSHFTRDFKTFAGETPQALRRRLLPGQHSILV